MSKVAYLKEDMLGNFSGLEFVKELYTVEDVATILDVYEETIKSNNYKNIKGFVKDDENYFYAVVSSYKEDFDLFDFINKNFDSDVVLSCINAKYIYPKRLSRGIYEGGINGLDIQEDDVATSFLDEGELDLPNIDEFTLFYKKTGTEIKVTSKGVIIGRSPSKVDFLISGNTKVGRTHCNVYIRKDGSLMVHDFGSVNGTFVNNVRVSNEVDVKLVSGDILVLADEEFRVI